MSNDVSNNPTRLVFGLNGPIFVDAAQGHDEEDDLLPTPTRAQCSCGDSSTDPGPDHMTSCPHWVAGKD